MHGGMESSHQFDRSDPVSNVALVQVTVQPKISFSRKRNGTSYKTAKTTKGKLE